MQIISGNPYSGSWEPVGGIQFYADKANSGNIYIGFSGGGPPLSGNFLTRNSGGLPLSGAAMLDGFPIPPGGGYFVPKLAFTNKGLTSGVYNMWGLTDAACSGTARLFWEML